VDGFHQALRLALFRGRLCSDGIMGKGEWLEGCGEGAGGLAMHGEAMEAKVRPLNCWRMLKNGVVCVGVCVGVFVCGREV
jgi:hypothetical protein